MKDWLQEIFSINTIKKMRGVCDEEESNQRVNHFIYIIVNAFKNEYNYRMVIITISIRNGCGIEHWKYLLPQPKRFVPSGGLNFGYITIQFNSSSL